MFQTCGTSMGSCPNTAWPVFTCEDFSHLMSLLTYQESAFWGILQVLHHRQPDPKSTIFSSPQNKACAHWSPSPPLEHQATFHLQISVIWTPHTQHHTGCDVLLLVYFSLHKMPVSPVSQPQRTKLLFMRAPAVPLCTHTAFHLPIHQLRDMLVVSNLGL